MDNNALSSEDIKELKVLHVATKEDYKFFVRYFFKMQYKRKWLQWEHLLLIIEVLKGVLSGEITRLIINVAPRYGKTDIVVKFFIAYCLALNAAAKFIHLSYSDDLALDNSETARDIVSSSEYQLLFPSVRIKKNSDSKKKWYTEAGGGVMATSTGGQITGFGAGITDDRDELEEMLAELDITIGDDWLEGKGNFGGAIIIDDPNKVDDADSEQLRKRVNDRFDSTISNRVNSRKTPIIIIQQRTHEDDLSGYVLRKQKSVKDGGIWHVLSLPSIKEDGTALCPQKHTIQELRALEQQNDVVFQRQHMQNPKPKAGLLFPIDELKFYDPASIDVTDPDYKYLAADPANLGGDDFSAMDARLIGNKIYIADVMYNTKGTDHNEVALLEHILTNNILYCGIEGVMGWKEVVDRVRAALDKKNYTGEVRLLKPRTAKHPRIVTRAAFIRNNFVFRKDWAELPQYAKFMRNLTSYLKIQEMGAKNKHDDAPDNCEMIASYYERNFPHLWEIV